MVSSDSVIRPAAGPSPSGRLPVTADLLGRVCAVRPHAVAALQVRLPAPVTDPDRAWVAAGQMCALGVELFDRVTAACIQVLRQGQVSRSVGHGPDWSVLAVELGLASDSLSRPGPAAGDTVELDRSAAPQTLAAVMTVASVGSALCSSIGPYDNPTHIVLTLWARGAEVLSPGEEELHAVFLAHLTQVTAGYLAVRRAAELAEQMGAAMMSRAEIEQAKGILMAAHQVGADEAFDLLRQRSQVTNTKLRAVAEEFVHRASHPDAPAGTDLATTADASPRH